MPTSSAGNALTGSGVLVSFDLSALRFALASCGFWLELSVGRAFDDAGRVRAGVLEALSLPLHPRSKSNSEIRITNEVENVLFICLCRSSSCRFTSAETVSAARMPSFNDGLFFFYFVRVGLCYCLNLHDGTVIWKFQAKDSFKATPTIAGDRIIASGLDHHVYCLNAKDGTLIWDFETGFEVDCSAAVVDGRVYFGSEDGFFYCLNLADGSLFTKRNGSAQWREASRSSTAESTSAPNKANFTV